MAFKIPCLAPRNVGLANLFLANGKFGYLYKANSGIDFQKKLRQILLNYKKAIIKSKYGYQALDRFNKNNTLLKLEKEISKIL